MTSRLDPDYVSDESDSISKVFADALAMANRNTYNEGSWQKWMVGICALLVVGGIGGAVAMYGQLTALEVRMEYIKYQVDDLKRIVLERHQ